MMPINFIYKVRKLFNAHTKEYVTMVKVFNPLDNTVTEIRTQEVDVLYTLQVDTRFRYKAYRVYFTDAARVKF